MIKRRTGLTARSENLPSAPIAEIALPSSVYTVTAQVLSLHPLDTVGSAWVWDGTFVRFSTSAKRKLGGNLAVEGSGPTQSREVTFSVPGGLLKSLDYQQIESHELPDDILGPAFELESTWIVDRATQLA